MWALALPFATALSAVPPNVDLNDIDHWESAAEEILDLPGGCWEWVGQASWDWRTNRTTTRGDAVFAGRTDSGIWGEVHLQPLGEELVDRRGTTARVYEREKARFVPLVGRMRGGRMVVAGDDEGAEEVKAEEPINVLRSALRRIGGDAFTSWAEWDDARGGVVLNRSIPLAEGRAEEIEVAIFFPSGGDVPSLLDVRFPVRFSTGRWPLKRTVRDAEVHVRGLIRGNVVYPSSEAFRFKYRFLGSGYHGAQTVVYKRITRCSMAPVPSQQLVMPTLPAQPTPSDDGAPPSDEGTAAADVETPDPASDGATGDAAPEGDNPEDGPEAGASGGEPVD